MLAAILFSVAVPASFASTFGGYECTDDCSGHAAGYKWASEHGIDSEQYCPEGNSQSFHEGCVVYTEDPNRGYTEDDDGNPIEEK
jgi:hypothetical protein